eukprot:Tamp_00950.p1 GENE.Tamp_00950~~Tamp_00950.p1  ORF type:complete len:343 (-),score=94.29 Tamp_00950:179-1207(-)
MRSLFAAWAWRACSAVAVPLPLVLLPFVLPCLRVALCACGGGTARVECKQSVVVQGICGHTPCASPLRGMHTGAGVGWNGGHQTMGLDLDGMLEDLGKAKEGSVFVLHTVAHNPSGVDPTEEQWKKIADLCEAKKAIPIFDTAYQGYATGDLDKDAFSVRYFAHERGMELMVTQSYSKNFGLYGERIGALNVVCKDAESAVKIQSQLGLIVRAMVSNPPLHGAQLVATVIANDALYKQWDGELKMMSNRIVAMRTALVEALKKIDCPTPNPIYSDWSHITSQIGMFAYTGLQAKHVKVLTDKYHIYCTANGRFSMAGVNPNNVGYIAEAMKDALTSAGPSDV